MRIFTVIFTIMSSVLGAVMQPCMFGGLYLGELELFPRSNRRGRDNFGDLFRRGLCAISKESP